ncbi:MAG: flagellar export chaperone FliS [Rhodospirillaceae bacterium]|nr:flagellar export chaperone FliS [Rhodospirillaceae bacterium]MEA4837747.1 flagellar export chaperone FliS [Rhodospirillaceae bacterium]
MPENDSKIQTQPPVLAVVKLYDLVLVHIAEAARHGENGDVPAQAEAVQEAMAIFTGLDSCLDMEAGGQVAANLRSMYQSMNQALTGVVGQPDGAAICLKLAAALRQTRNAWAETVGVPAIS